MEITCGCCVWPASECPGIGAGPVQLFHNWRARCDPNCTPGASIVVKPPLSNTLNWMFRCSCSQIPNSISLARALFIPKKERLLLRIYNNVFNRRLFRGRDLTIYYFALRSGHLPIAHIAGYRIDDSRVVILRWVHSRTDCPNPHLVLLERASATPSGRRTEPRPTT